MADIFDELDAVARGQRARGADGGPVRLRKRWTEVAGFAVANALVLPVVAICYQLVSADGLRRMLSVFSTRLYKMPVPGAAYLEGFDGWNRLDGACLAAVLLFGAVTYLWYRVFAELVGDGPLIECRTEKPILFWLLVGVAGVVIAGDAVIFYAGLVAKTAGGWSETPWFVPPLATLLFLAGQALIGWWHADWRQSGAV